MSTITANKKERAPSETYSVNGSSCFADQSRIATGDLQARASVDAAMDWHHSTVRKSTAGLVWNRVLIRTMGVAPSGNEAVAKEAETTLRLALQVYALGNWDLSPLSSVQDSMDLCRSFVSAYCWGVQ